MKKTLFFLILALLITSCHHSQEVTVPEKHPNIPETAFWQGGIDGGAWYDCTATKQDYQYHCVVYNDFTGDVTIDDLFDLTVSVNRQDIPIQEYAKMNDWNPDKVSFFDGDDLHLQGTLVLKPVNGLFADE